MRAALRTAGLCLAALLVGPTAASAQGLALEPDRGCYAPNQLIELTGYGFTPDSEVALHGGGLPLGWGFADYDGIFRAEVRAPALPFPEAELRFTAIDGTYRLNRASTYVRLTSVGVRIGRRSQSPSAPLRIRARGFFGGRTLYAHVRRGERVRTVRVGRLRGACRRLAVSRRLFGPAARAGSYRVHFDTVRRYARDPGRRVTYSVRIDPPSATAAAATSGSPPLAASGPLHATWHKVSDPTEHGSTSTHAPRTRF